MSSPDLNSLPFFSSRSFYRAFLLNCYRHFQQGHKPRDFQGEALFPKVIMVKDALTQAASLPPLPFLMIPPGAPDYRVQTLKSCFHEQKPLIDSPFKYPVYKPGKLDVGGDWKMVIPWYVLRAKSSGKSTSKIVKVAGIRKNSKKVYYMTSTKQRKKLILTPVY